MADVQGDATADNSILHRATIAAALLLPQLMLNVIELEWKRIQPKPTGRYIVGSQLHPESVTCALMPYYKSTAHSLVDRLLLFQPCMHQSSTAS